MANFDNLSHYSVLLNESIDALQIKENGIYVDCTLGGGGHSSKILEKIPKGWLYAFDQDEMAIDVAKKRLESIGKNFTIINKNFETILDSLKEQNVKEVDGIIYDLGVSSFQFDLPERGFSYRFDARLDMRMDLRQELDAYQVVNNYSEEELANIFFKYGEDKNARLIARKIVQERKNKPIETTFELVDVIKSALPAKILRQNSHPAKQIFQALRIEVNGELSVLEKSLNDALELLKVGGRIVVITFHSLEDRIVKNIFKEHTTINLPKGLPFIPDGYEVKYNLVNRHVILPSDEELSVNNRSHSAKMRIIEKIKN